MNTSHLFCFASLASPCRCALWSLLSGMPSPLSPQVWGWCNVRTQGPVSSKAEQLFLIGAWAQDTESFCWNIWVPRTHHPEPLADQVQTYGHSSNRLSALCSLSLTAQLPCWSPRANYAWTHTHIPQQWKPHICSGYTVWSLLLLAPQTCGFLWLVAPGGEPQALQPYTGLSQVVWCWVVKLTWHMA